MFIVTASLVSALPFWSGGGRWSSYVVGKDGAIYKKNRGGNQPSEVVDLNGKQLVDPQTGHAVSPSEFSPAPLLMWIDVNLGARQPKDDYPRTWFNFGGRPRYALVLLDPVRPDGRLQHPHPPIPWQLRPQGFYNGPLRPR